MTAQTTVKPYTARTADPADGATSRRSYATLAGARARFEEMSGHTLEAAISEMFWMAPTKPAADRVRHVRTVSDYGTVVTFDCPVLPEFQALAPAPAIAADALPDTFDECLNAMRQESRYEAPRPRVPCDCECCTPRPSLFTHRAGFDRLIDDGSNDIPF